MNSQVYSDDSCVSHAMVGRGREIKRNNSIHTIVSCIEDIVLIIKAVIAMLTI